MTWSKLLCALSCGIALLPGCRTRDASSPSNARAAADADAEAAESGEQAENDPSGTDETGATDQTSEGEGEFDPDGGPTVEEELALEAVRQHLLNTPDTDDGSLKFAVVQRGPSQPWVMGVVNQGEQEALLVADPRLVSFDVKVPGKQKSVTCQLPGSLRPQRAQRRYRVLLAPGEGVVKVFDPRLYCFASSGQRVLVPGAIVMPRFGWPEKVKTIWKNGKKQTVPVEQEPPFVARILDVPVVVPPSTTTTPKETTSGKHDSPEPAPIADAPQARGVKELRASSIALDSEYKSWSSVGLHRERKTRSPIVIDMKQGSDAHSQLNATVAITLKNRSKRRHYLYFRRELLSLEIMGPGGAASCDPEPDTRAPDRQAFLSLGPGQSMTITSRLVEMCPKGTFGRPGFYLVHARFHTDADGEEYGMDAYVGTVATETPANVRIRTGELDPRERQAMRPLVVLE